MLNHVIASWERPNESDPASLGISSDPDAGATRDKLAALIDHAGSGIRINLEFGLFTGVKTIHQAAAILREIDAPESGLLIDALHWTRSGGTVADIAALPREWFSYAQLCDAPHPGADPLDPDAILEEALDGRVALGQGGLDLAALLAALPDGLPIAIEERSKRLRDNFPDLNERAVELMLTSRAWMNAATA